MIILVAIFRFPKYRAKVDLIICTELKRSKYPKARNIEGRQTSRTLRSMMSIVKLIGKRITAKFSGQKLRRGPSGYTLISGQSRRLRILCHGKIQGITCLEIIKLT